MAVLRFKSIKAMNENDRKQKLKELRIELIKKKSVAGKQSKIKAKEIKKAIARILTLKTK